MSKKTEKFVLGIIPARGASKRIRGKALALLGGKKLLSYAIEEAKKSKLLSEVIVSTESSEIALEAKKLGALVPFKRPKELALDETPMLPVLKQAVIESEKFFSKKVDAVVLLQLTSPFRKARHIDEAVRIFLKGGIEGVVSVSRAKTEPKWMLKKKSGVLEFYEKNDFSASRKQDMKEFFELNGAVYVFSRETVMNSKGYAWGKRIAAYEMDKISSIDIDEPIDLEIANALLRASLNEND